MVKGGGENFHASTPTTLSVTEWTMDYAFRYHQAILDSSFSLMPVTIATVSVSFSASPTVFSRNALQLNY